jgi:hypothetical protein
LGILAVAFSSADAFAQPTSDAAVKPAADGPERRGGLVVGAAGGFALAGASGYPNDERVYGNPDSFSSTPLLAGSSTSFFLLGALSDYVNFGPAFTFSRFDTARWSATGAGGGFRAEVFPLLRTVPSLADFAIYGQAGLGRAELQAKGPYPKAEGMQSLLTIGIHHEWRIGKFLGGHGSFGPYVEYTSIFSRTAEQHWASAGLRIVFYGGRVELDR